MRTSELGTAIYYIMLPSKTLIPNPTDCPIWSVLPTEPHRWVANTLSRKESTCVFSPDMHISICSRKKYIVRILEVSKGSVTAAITGHFSFLCPSLYGRVSVAPKDKKQPNRQYIIQARPIHCSSRQNMYANQ